jgi:Spy/CpxP family protein refolding chaperone
MKSRVLVLAALAACSTLALADPPDGPPQGMHGGPNIERLAADLGLNDNQKAQVKQILDAQHAKMQAARQQFEASGTRPTREEMKSRHEQMDAELHQQLAGVLTADQLKKFDEMRAQHRHQGPPPGPPPGE